MMQLRSVVVLSVSLGIVSACSGGSSKPKAPSGQGSAGSAATATTVASAGRAAPATGSSQQLDAGGGAGSAGKSAAASGAGGAGSATPPAANDAGSAGRGVDAGTARGAGTDLPGWKLVWNDEFDGPADQTPDASRWVPETGGNGWGNNELEFYTDRATNAALDGQGALVITARSEMYMGRNYTSARLKTQGKFEHTYGRFEARIQIPAGQGLWPAFWMLGNDIGSASWPTCGEIDIMENVGKEPSTVHGTIHGPGYSGGNGIGSPDMLSGNQRFADAYHVFAIEWETSAIRFYVDDKLFATRTPAGLPKGAKWVYDHPFFILLNVAVGGQWPGNPDGTTTFPQRMLVDYVRVYDKAP